MPQRKAASKAKAQISEQQDDGRQDITITAPATIARDGLIADQPSQREDKLSPLKRRHEAQAKDLDSATKSEDATKWYLEIEERVNKAMKATREEPVPDPRATPTRAPPEDHYLSGRQWARIDRKTFTRGFDSLDGAMYQWTYNFANDEPDEIETRMTAEDKQAIIDFLGDWCLYDDWDSLVASFSPLAYLGRFQILLTATVLKNVFESVVRNPFFYIDLGMDWDGSGSDLPTEYGEELNNLFQKALRVSARGAHHWRASTIRLFNRYMSYSDSDTILMAKDVTPGVRAYNLREKCIDHFTSKMLDSSSLISPMLSSRQLSQQETRIRFRELRDCFKIACDMAVRFSLQKAGFQFDENVKEVAPYRMPRDDPNDIDIWVASTFAGPSIYRELLEGRRAVLVLWPATWIIEWKVFPDVRKSREEIDGKHPPDYDGCYRDEKGVLHAVISSGVVIVEKDGREPPLDA